MRVDPKELNACPPLLNQKQLRRVCHISPRTAHYLLQSGAIPNERGSQYRIRREDVLAFMQSSEKLLVPAPVRTSTGKWGKPHTVRLLPPEAAPESTLRACYICMFADLPDVLTVPQISAATGYNVRTVGQWLRLGWMRCIMLDNAYHVPKRWAIDYLCSDQHNSTHRKSPQHVAALWAAYEGGVTA